MVPLTKYSKLGYSPTITLFADLADMTPVVIPMPEPPDTNKIHNISKPASEQYFQRTELPKKWNSLTEKEQNHFAWHEWNKRLNGYWFMNNGKLTYITGLNYFYVNWWKMTFGYPDFWLTDCEMFWHWKHRQEDPTSFGICDIETRQTGKSSKLGCMLFESASRTLGWWSGLQSRTDKAAMELFERKVIYPWRNLPDFFRPVYDATSAQKNELRFQPAIVTGKAANDTLFGDISKLDSVLNYGPSNLTAYDSATLDFYGDDEYGKIEGKVAVNPYSRWLKVKPGLFEVKTKRIRGKSFHITTVENMDTVFGGKIAKEMFMDSHINTVNELGQTKSGLHQHFTPSYRLMDQNKYGGCDEKANKEYLLKMRKNLKGEKLGEVIRKYPMTVKECFTISGTNCPFNTAILDFVLNKYSLGNEDVAFGNFVWQDDVRDSKVIFRKSDEQKTFSPTGRWCVSYLFDNPALSNAKIIKNGKKYPANTDLFSSGADPFKYDTEAIRNHDKESLGGGCVGRKLNSAIDNPKDIPWGWDSTKDGDRTIKIHHLTNRTCCEYLWRPSTVEEYCEDMLMMCIYYGCQIFPEKNVDVIERYFKARGYEKYLYFQLDEKTGRLEQSAGDTTDKWLTQELIAVLATHIEQNGYREVHHEWLVQARQFDGDFGPYDLLMAKAYQLLSEKRKTITAKKINANDKPENWFQGHTV